MLILSFYIFTTQPIEWSLKVTIERVTFEVLGIYLIPIFENTVLRIKKRGKVNIGDKSILDILGHVRTAGGANYGKTMYAQDLIRKVSNQIDTQKEKSERWRWQQEDRRLLERDRALAIELGEWYNNKNKPPEGWNEEESWKIQKMVYLKLTLI